jgi:chloramphenicol 3-O phosphotransferase
MIIYLNGTSSSGKTTVAKLIQEELKGNFFYFSIDTLLYALPEKTLKSIETGGDLVKELDWEGIFSSYFQCLKSLSENSQNVIGDCPIYLEKQFESFANSLELIDNLFIVGIDCPIDVLKSRELEREDRAIGLAEKQSESIHNFLHYNIKVDSSKQSPKEILMMIKNAVSVR